MTEGHLFILGGAFVGGLISGITGFGTGMVALPIWLQATTPLLASPLVVICSLVAQLQTLPAIWHALHLRRLAPFVIGGALGVPVGAWLLPQISADLFKAGLGTILVLLCGFLLAGGRQFQMTWGGRLADASIGWGAGILGGIAGLSGPLPTVWASLRGWAKDERRAVFQGFNTTILSLALASQAFAGYLTAELGQLVLYALPGTFLGALVGRRIYDRLDTRGFEKIVLWVLFAAGVAMVCSVL